MKFILSRVVFIVRIIFRGIFENTIRAAETWTPPPHPFRTGSQAELCNEIKQTQDALIKEMVLCSEGNMM